MPPKVDPAVDAYLAKLPEAQRDALAKVRATLRRALPGVDEGMSYGMPAFKHGASPIFGYGARGDICLLAPMSGEVTARLAKELKGFTATKGLVKFEAAKPVPPALLRKLLAARLAELEGASKARSTKKAARKAAPKGTPSKKEDVGAWKGGKRVGKWTFYHSDRKTLKAKGAYDQAGLFTGRWTWYAANGLPRQVGSFVEGEQHGLWRRYYGGTRQLVDRGRYHHGKRVGAWTFYTKEGNVRRRQDFGAPATTKRPKRSQR